MVRAKYLGKLSFHHYLANDVCITIYYSLSFSFPKFKASITISYLFSFILQSNVFITIVIFYKHNNQKYFLGYLFALSENFGSLSKISLTFLSSSRVLVLPQPCSPLFDGISLRACKLISFILSFSTM